MLCRGAITALKFSLEGKLLFSASKDHLICIWDASNWQLIRSFNYGKGILQFFFVEKNIADKLAAVQQVT